MQDDLNYFYREDDFFWKMEEDHIFYKLKMAYFFSLKRKMTSIYMRMEDNLKKEEYKKTECYAMLTISTSQLLPGNLTNTTTQKNWHNLKNFKKYL